jgi:hypothetical protein
MDARDSRLVCVYIQIKPGLDLYFLRCFSDISCNMSYHPTGLSGAELDDAMTIFTEANVIGGFSRERINWDRNEAIAALRAAFPSRCTRQTIAACDVN